jgi:hypothetical protein
VRFARSRLPSRVLVGAFLGEMRKGEDCCEAVRAELPISHWESYQIESRVFAS